VVLLAVAASAANVRLAEEYLFSVTGCVKFYISLFTLDQALFCHSREPVQRLVAGKIRLATALERLR
jgi:hypothetical protein